jgi:hypothetical protein
MATSDVDPFGGLTGESRDIYAAMAAQLKAYGLESLAPTLLGFVQQGYTEATISNLLPETQAYKQRFAANAARVKAGLPALQPAEYLSVEQSYRQVMSAAGLPVGFYDEPSDFQKWIESDVSPSEINDRVQIATRAINSLDPTARSQFERFYSTGDMIAYALDRERATTVLERQFRAAEAAGTAQQNRLSLSQDQAERIARADLSPDQQRSAVAATARLAERTSQLSRMYGGQYDTDAAIGEVFEDNNVTAESRRRLQGMERAQFGGSDQTQSTALSRRRAGQV